LERVNLEPIFGGMYLLRSETDGKLPQSHSVVIRDDVHALIDACCGFGLLERYYKESAPDQVIVSHAHVDHMAGLYIFQGCEILSPREHSEIFWKLDAQADRFVGDDPIKQMWKEHVQFLFGVQDCQADAFYGDGHVFDFGSIKLEAIHAPGHTDDSYVLFEPEQGILLAFDIDLTRFGPWYGNPEGDIDGFADAIELCKDLDPKILVSSHKGVIKEDIQGQLDEYGAVIEKRDKKIMELLSEPRTLQYLEDASPIHGGFPYAEEMLRYFERNMVRKHLERLHGRGLVVQAGDRWERA